jgi:hypothetical protein
MMTVRELIELLQKLPQNARVIVQGYEDGYNDIGDAQAIPIKINVNEEWYYGNHDDPRIGDTPDEIAILIG